MILETKSTRQASYDKIYATNDTSATADSNY